ncbi:carbohydrate ABC transporter membrane protein 2 (CUT1 family) [Planifilum fimeticola]|jgi:multiple sugar transport system permease protein|uniref:Carbohydrate ABC transporter membrane protein 2 (CUT1 family) n=1 Tax=Planifilum fimeticola TaxID=201975 RepID=A0A2T0LFG8_9BACL|nr:carbohydrate ABC transporter permease [Planifilum fimeticola]PRX40967.1 carbohydrate ABC transporter membrane protein 2 (CUT1 family) [Planifilum fimeticola]
MTRDQSKAAGKRRSLAYHLKRTVLPHVFLSLVGLIFLFPFVWLFLNSLKTPQEIFSLPPKLWPEELQWSNYARAFQSMPFFGYVLNTLFLVIANIVGHLFSAPLVAYSLAKIRWRGRGAVFALVLATVILPPQVTMIPMYIIFAKLGWVNTYLPLIIPSFLGSSFNIFLLRQFLLGIPNELSDAARIDGASEFRIYWQIMLPLLMPPLAAIAIFTFQGVWHDFFGPLIYLNDERLWTISVGLQGFLQQHGAQWELLMAAATLFTLPSVIAYFIGQKYFIQAGTQLVQYK